MSEAETSKEKTEPPKDPTLVTAESKTEVSSSTVTSEAKTSEQAEPPKKEESKVESIAAPEEKKKLSSVQAIPPEKKEENVLEEPITEITENQIATSENILTQNSINEVKSQAVDNEDKLTPEKENNEIPQKITHYPISDINIENRQSDIFYKEETGTTLTKLKFNNVKVTMVQNDIAVEKADAIGIQ